MKKVLYNRFTKLLEFACILIAVTILLLEGIGVNEWILEKEKYVETVYEELSAQEPIDVCYKELSGFMENLIWSYKEGGMEDVESYFNFEVVNSSCRIIVTTPKEVFIYPEDAIYKEKYSTTPNIFYGAAKLYKLWNRVAEDSIYLRLSSDALIYKGESYSGDDYVYEKPCKLNEYLSAEAIEYLASIDYKIELKIAYPYSVIRELYQYRDYSSRWQADEKYGDIEGRIYAGINVYIVCGVIIVIASLLLIISCGRKTEGKKELNYWEKRYTDIHVIFAILTMTAICLGTIFFMENYTSIMSGYRRNVSIGAVAGILLGVSIFYYEMGILVKKIINRRLLKDLFIVKVFSVVRKWLKGVYDKSKYAALPEIKRLYTKRVIMDVLVVLMDITVIFLLNDIWNGYFGDTYLAISVVLLIFTVIYMIFSIKEYKHLRIYNRVAENINLIYNGHFNKIAVEPDEEHELLNQLVNLSAGFKESVAKQVEAEKLQVELVANVSHDLKTPLTSIISYVDLLSKEELPSVASDYVRILEEKSSRLKDIVADVFDLAKATSGEQVPMEQLDGVVLINQVLSDMCDRIEESGKELKVKVETETAPITGNGQKLYRVFQNVIDNALKYSMPGTRIYLAAEYKEDQFIVTLKNVSEYEMNFTEEEIMSRFTRGDKARHSEGNGLGLSIAKSFTELCGGTFDIEIDDDIFKVKVVLR